MNRVPRAFGAVAALRRLYRLLLRAHPEPVRREYAEELWETVRALEEDVTRTNAPRPLTRFWLREVIALLGSAVRAHVDLRRRDGRLDLRTRSVARDGASRPTSAGRPGPASVTRETAQRLLRDVRHAVRLLFRRPSYAILTVLTLALGIGANTAIFSVIDGVLLEVFPGLDGSRLVHVWERNLAQGGDRWELAPADFEDYRNRTDVVERNARAPLAHAPIDAGTQDVIRGRVRVSQRETAVEPTSLADDRFVVAKRVRITLAALAAIGGSVAIPAASRLDHRRRRRARLS